MARPKQILNSLWFVIPDLLWMLVSLHVALTYKYGSNLDRAQVALHYRIFLPVFLAWLLILFIHNAFDPKTLRRYIIFFFGILSAAFFSFLVAVVYFYFQPDLLLTPRRFLIVLTASGYILIFLWHLAIKLLLKNRIVEEYYLYSPHGELDALHGEMLSHGYLGIRVIKHIASDEELKSLAPGAKVIVAESVFDDKERAQVVYKLRAKGVWIDSQVEFTERLLRRVPLNHVNESWLLKNIWAQSTRLQNILSRAWDILAGIIFCVVFIVTFPFISTAIRLTSPGPIFFSQQRVGKHSIVYSVHKYRTMSSDGSGKGWTKINDQRITSVGRFLRRLHLDELPQFMNLLSGTMSVVGPRPEQVEIVQQLKASIPFYEERLAVKPGITGWAQLNIYAASLEESKIKLEYDLYYLKHRSVLFDAEIILKTLYSIFVNKLN